MLFVVAAALVDEDGRVLLAERPQGKPMAGLWEFPGGKVAADETPEEALVRELQEELAIRTAPCCLRALTFVTHPLGDSGQPDGEAELLTPEGCNPLAELPPQDPDDMLLMLLYLCRRWHGIPQPCENQAIKWVRPQAMGDFPMPPADKPLVRVLQDML